MSKFLVGTGVVAALSVIALGGYCAYLQWRLSKCQLAPAKEAVAAEDKHVKITRKVITLDADALRREYCEWVRDDKELCLQANIPISEGSID